MYLLELPREPRLAHARDTDDRQQMRAPRWRSRKELLGHAQLALAADEQRLEPAEAAFSLPRRDDPECLPQRRLSALAFELVLPGVRAC